MSQLGGRRRFRKRRVRPVFYFWMLLLAVIIVCLVLLFTGEFTCVDTPEPTPIPIPTIIPTTPPPQSISPTSVPGTDPSSFGFVAELSIDGETVPAGSADGQFDFGIGDVYTELEGVISFRGDNFRNSPSYGVAAIRERIIDDVWNIPTYSLSKGVGGNYSGAWTGSGWTGQPLIVRWPESTKAIMNMYDWAKAKDDLVEVIYATMDGNIYFLDLETGEATRDKMDVGVPFKGAGSLDPRGIPLLYIGSGDHYDEDGRRARAMIISLVDCSVLYEFGIKDDEFALREWTAYDSSALVCADADSLVYPGENGILYVLKLNTQYDEATGTLTVSPDNIRKLRYSADRTRNEEYWLGYEGSAAAYGSYVFLTENSGLMHCVDLNTMDVIWVQDIWDDTNATPVFELNEDGSAYLYVGSSLDNKADENGFGEVALFKIDALTGEIVWKHVRSVYTTSGVTGGVMTSAVLGENELEGLIYVVYASYGNGNRGDMVAIDTETNEIVWEIPLSAYAWSSPAAVYDEEGHGYLVQCNYSGNVYLIDGLTGDICYTYNIESNIEASPAVFNDIIVIGTRVQGIWGLQIK